MTTPHPLAAWVQHEITTNRALPRNPRRPKRSRRRVTEAFGRTKAGL